MHVLIRRVTYVTVSLIVVSLSLLSSPGPFAAPASAASHRHSWVSRAAMQRASSTGLLFVSSVVNPSFDHEGVVDIYDAKHPTSPIGEITGYLRDPGSLAVDKSGNLFVYSWQTNAILEFQPPYTAPPTRQLYDHLSGVFSMTIDSTGTLYTANANTNQIVEFANGSSSSTILSFPVSPDAVTLDKKGNLVCTFSANVASGVLRYSSASPIPQNLFRPLQMSAGDLLFDKQGNLVVADRDGGYINIYAPGKRDPIKTITNGIIYPWHIAFDARRQTLYVGDIGSNSVIAYAYPDWAIRWTLTGFGSVGGVAVSPAAIP